jgi:hypothetical protein
MVRPEAGFLAAALVAAAALCVEAAGAAPPRTDGKGAVPDERQANAQAAFEEGLSALRDADWPLAEARFRYSLTLVARPSARYNLAFVLFQQDRASECLGVLEELLAQPDLDPSYREPAEALTARARARLAAGPAPGVARRSAAPPLAPKAVTERPAALPRQEKRPATDRGTDPKKHGSSVHSWGPWASLAVGGALFVAGGVTGIFARRADDRLSDGCPEHTRCDPSLRKDYDEAIRLGRVTDVLLVSGAAFIAGGVTWRVVAPPVERRSASLRPSMVTVTVRY